MACIASLATTKLTDFRRIISLLKTADSDEWWDIPETYETAISEWIGNTGLDGSLTFKNVPKGLGFYDTAGFSTGKSAIADAVAKIDEIVPLVRQGGGRFSLQSNTVDELSNALTLAKSELSKLSGSRWLEQYFKLSPSYSPQPGFFEGVPFVSFETSFSILKHELEERTAARQALMTAIEAMEVALDYIGSSDCQPEPSSDDNCDRIADALEAIAAKDFTCPEPDLTPVIEAVEKLSGAIGVVDLDAGIKLPKLITQPPKDNKGKDSDYVTVKSIPEFLIWNFTQIDALIGRFPIEIIQKDSDITEEGDQDEKIVIPNLSEGIAELLALSAVNAVNQDVVVKAEVSALTEIVSLKQMVVQARYILDNLQQWASFGVQQKRISMPVVVDIKKTKLDEFLQPAKLEITVDDYRLNSDGSDFDFERVGKIVNTIYAIVATAFCNRISKDDPTGSFRSDLSKIKDGQLLNDEDDEDSFGRFVNRAEIGFTDAPGSLDSTNPRPYGRDRERRPIIKRTEGMGLDDIQDGDTDGGNP